MIEKVKEKINIINKMKNINILKYLNIILTNDFLLYIMDYYKYSLNDMIKKHYFNTIELKYTVIKSICNGICEIHRNGLIHGNIKPQNILFNDDLIYKITDYSVYNLFKLKCNISVNNIHYLSPEYIKQEDITKLTDIWNIGCIIYLLINEKDPFEGKNQFEILEKIIKYDYDKIIIKEYKIYNEILSKLLCDKNKRIKAIEIPKELRKIHSKNILNKLKIN